MTSQITWNRRIVMEDAQSNLPNLDSVGNHLRYVYLGPGLAAVKAWVRKVKEKDWQGPS